MLPQSLAALIGLLALVAPGLVFQWERERDEPAHVESGFREVSRIVLASLVFSWASMVLLLAIEWLAKSWASLKPLINLGAWVKRGDSYADNHLSSVALATTVEVVLACGLAWLGARGFGWFGSHKKDDARIVHTTPWYSVLQGVMGKGEVPWVLVNLKDGTSIWGKVHRYTLGQVPSAERQLALTGPSLTVRRPPRWRDRLVGRSAEPVEEDYWEFIVINADDIAMLKVARSK